VGKFDREEENWEGKLKNCERELDGMGLYHKSKSEKMREVGMKQRKMLN
jgi:hypothetical protein